MGIDINSLRAEKGGNPEKYRESETLRFRDPKLIDEIIDVDNAWRKQVFQLKELQKQANDTAKQVSQLPKNGKEEREKLIQQAKEIKLKVGEVEKQCTELLNERNLKLSKVGNLLQDNVPVSKDEKDNLVIRKWGQPNEMKIDGTRGHMHHHEIISELKLIDSKKGSWVCGHRGYYLFNEAADMIEALKQYAIHFLKKKAYQRVITPEFMRKEVMSAVAELKDFEETLYRIPNDKGIDADDLFLIATSEQPLVALQADTWLENKDLPLRYCGISSCFRREAGAYGKETWGIFRVHQFDKIEQFCIVHPSDSEQEHLRMISIAEEFYQSLGLPYRIVNICTGELNDAAAAKYDLEAWFPGYANYRELVSCSNCTDYQARAVGTKIRVSEKDNPNVNHVTPHMLNGTLVAAQRCFCCILENYQTSEGIRVPSVLIPYMGGVEFIPFPQTS